MKTSQLILRVFTKKAKGYMVKEKTDEYVMVDGQLTVTKRKVVTKHIPPDINAIKALLQLDTLGQMDITNMSDEQLLEERTRLLNTLQLCDSDNITNNREEN